ncbi:VWFA-related protein [Silvibacterium bohemicum]|uniref:VWFA-related protein n=1 Tax=Silvibacterium bohemicum TaxID=1577686 RepID=A0A841JVW9_9BACT|nr:VWA domain-containing protein [Silvibacterium bohemicum]MBB6142124.1 VWFA-related protein [Silvibacterium bohemicum]
MTRSPAAVLFTCLFAASALAAQTAAPATSGDTPSQNQTAAAPPVAFRAQVNLVLVDAVVTNNGAVVSGLDKDKFKLYQDGKLQQIRIFEEHKPEETTLSSVGVQLPPNTYSNFPQYNIAGAANVLLLDALNTPLSDQVYVRQQMLKYLKNIPPGTRIAVFTLASRLRIVEGFTTDSDVIAKALSGKGGPQQSSILDPDSDQQLSNQISDMSGLGGSQDVISSMQQFEADMTSFQTDVRVETTLDAMKQLARYLSVIPGRKNLIWFSGSFPLAIDPDSTLQDEFSGMRNYSDEVRQTDDMLSAARVAVYPVDARGLLTLPSVSAANSYTTTPAGVSAETSGMGGRGGKSGVRGSHTIGGGGGSSQPAAAAADRKFMAQTIQEHDSMRQIAEDTGGEAFMDTNGLKDAVAKAIGNGSHYYTIGYVPTLQKYDGAFHRIRLNVDGGAVAEYRRGYYADDPSKAAVDPQASLNAMNGAVARGAPPLADILFKVRVLPADDPSAKDVKLMPGLAGEQKDLKSPVKRFLIDYAVDPHPFAFTVAQDGSREAHVEFAVIGYDADGKRLNYTDKGMSFHLTQAMYDRIMQSGVPMHQEIDLPAGSIHLRIVVHDLNSGRVGSTELPLTVAKK